jgi:hypothetical protein
LTQGNGRRKTTDPRADDQRAPHLITI